MMGGMSTLDSSSSRQDVLDAIADNASYEEDSSLAKAKAYLTALRIWKNRFAFDEDQVGSNRMRFDGINRTLTDDIKNVQAWIEKYAITSAPKPFAGYSLIDISGGCR